MAELEAELAAAQRTIDVLMDRVEQPALSAGADRFALLKTIAHLQDEVRQASRRSEQSAAHYQALYNQSPDAVLSIDADGRISACNHTAERLLGRDQKEVRGAALSAVLDPGSGAALTTLLWSGFSGVGESDVGLSDGRRLSFSVARLGEPGWLLVLRDVTRHHQLHQELTNTRRLASVGQLAASVAHEINRPLSVIHGRLELLAAQGKPDVASVARQVGVIKEHVARIEGLVRDLQTFAVHRCPRRAWIPMRRIIAAAQAEVAGRLRRLRVEVRVEPADLRVRGDDALLTQLVINLVRQVSDDCPPGAELTLTATAMDGGVRLTVSGECRGLSDVALDQLRSPYSGRQVDPAMGLHLAIVWAIAQDHGGWLTATNLDNGGASFYVNLPDRDPSEQEDGQSRRSLRILVVDDDQLLCETLTWMLGHEGHTITAAASAEEALEWLVRDTFDAVITDYLLPGMDGEELAAIIEVRWPALSRCTVLTSGLLHTPKRDNAYLQKPFTQAQLVGLVRSLDIGGESDD